MHLQHRSTVVRQGWHAAAAKKIARYFSPLLYANELFFSSLHASLIKALAMSLTPEKNLSYTTIVKIEHFVHFCCEFAYKMQ